MCIYCGSTAPVAGNRCTACGRTLDASDLAAAPGAAGTPTPTPAPPSALPTPTGDDVTEILTKLGTVAGSSGTGSGLAAAGLRSSDSIGTGQAFAGRYTMIRMLGMGGMGAVYQAWDQELGVVVAVKIIRPEVMQDAAAAADLERRFKRELLLARAVTHKNVVRIHDIGDVNGIKYITMPYVHGRDLATELRHTGKLPVGRAIRVAREVAAGLVAAHQAGVIHRDLKPANIMLDADDHALIMDFGIARSAADTAGATKGVITGTLGYMSPEQAHGAAVDHRADIYSFGLILSDMLLGRRPAAENESAFSELMSRMQQPPPPLRSVDPTIPEAVERIVAACLQPNADHRYRRTEDLAADLEGLDDEGKPIGPGGQTRTMAATAVAMPVRERRRLHPASIAAIAAAALVVAVVGLFGWRFLDRRTDTGPPAETVSLAILPFRNASGDASLNWLGPNIPETLRTEIGQSSQLRTVPPDRLHQLLRDLRIDAESTFDSSSLGRVAEFTSADVVLWGQYLKFGSEIRIDATLQDVKRQRSVPLKAQAAGESGLLAALDGLAQSVRDNLAVSRQTAAELKATALKPSSTSLAALRHYSEGVQFTRQGKYLDARKSYEAAVQDDSSFALAYARLASTAAQLGDADSAANYARTAAGLSDRLPPQEKLVIAATQARILNNYTDAIQLYERLAATLADSDDVRLALGGLYESVGAYPKAKEQYATLVARDPKYLEALLALGRVETRLNAQSSLEHLNRAMQLAVELDNQQAKSDVLRSLGQAYRALGKPEDAIRQFEQSLEIERRLNRPAGIADATFGIAATRASAGQLDLALQGYNESLALRRQIGDASGIAAALAGLGNLQEQRGQYDQALTYYKDALQGYRETGSKSSEALMLNNIGNLYLSRGELEDARTYFERALTLYEAMKAPVDTARTLHNLAVTSANGGDYEAATRYYVRALDLRRQGGDRRGTAIESYSLGVLFEYQAQFGKALDAHAEALTILHDANESGFWLAAILGQQGSALSQAGRFGEAAKALDEALQGAKALRHQALIAQILSFQGDNAYYQGDARGARGLYESAQQALGTTKDRRTSLLLKVDLARPGVSDKPSVAALRELVTEADAIGYKHLAVECNVNLGDALLRSGATEAARQELERAVSRSERLGLRIFAARSHQLLAAVDARAGREADARRHHDEARALVDAIAKDARSDDVLKRADLGAIVK